ncbi:hypothetical protein CC80DRAFT_544128 [Byssothecium circinans]|uniref:BZIP domain-containing protein n=1 Tax=Byssothecium circinans TaxID=147558 RepID=A0A6A5U742_9PLEO|nr:hypothetical protein CC80DRAFT_544128 [Byssothecium circinans]
MVRKTQDTPSSIRIRENQKRSRDRRKGLLDSLQKRVQDFELNGVRATHEMQQAARRVAQENERLRSLLALHGVSRERVDLYLSSFDGSGATNCPQVTSMKTTVPCQSSTPETASGPASNTVPPTWKSVAENPSVSHLSGRDFGHDGQALQREPWNVNQSSKRYQGRDLTVRHLESAPLHGHLQAASESSSVMSQVPENYSETQNIDRPNSRVHEFAASEKADLCPNDPDCFCPPISAIEDGSSSPGLETSCETAARIIIEMSGDKDRDLVRASLGCSGRGDCNVKNTTILQVMGEM